MINFFKKIIKNKKFVIFSLFGILGLLFLIPYIAHADAFGVMDIFSMQLDALDFLDNSIRKYLVLITLIIAESMAYLGIASAILDWAIQLEANIIHNPLVTAGWGFVSGIANLVIIISFVWTGLSMILQGDTKKGQSTLFRLIFIAIFVNFSLLAVGALVDIAGFFQWGIMNAFSTGGEGVSLAKDAQQTLWDYSTLSLAQMVAITVGETLFSLVPVGNVASIVVSAIGFLTLSITGWLPIMFFNIILNFIIGSTFFLLAAILLMRICFLWILAITAPLAVVLYKSELPFFNKFYNEWWKYFMDWLFAGVIIIFFLGLGFKLFGIADGSNTIINWGNPFETVPLFGQFTPKFFINYVFLFLYMVVVCLLMAKNWIPALGQDIINLGTGFASKLNKTLTPRIKRDVLKWEAGAEQKYNQEMEKYEQYQKDVKEMGNYEFFKKYSIEDHEKYKEKPERSNMEKPFATYRHWFKKGITANDELQSQHESNKDKYKDLTADRLEELISTNIAGGKINIGPLNQNDLTSALMGMKSKEVTKLLEKLEGSNNEALLEKVYDAVNMGNSDLHEKIARSFILGDAKDETRVQRILGATYNSKKYGSKVEQVVSEATGEKFMDISLKAFEAQTEQAKALKEFIGKHLSGNELGARGKKENGFIKMVNQPDNYNIIINAAKGEGGGKSNETLVKYLGSKTCPFCEPKGN